MCAWVSLHFCSGKAQGLGYFPNIAAFMITVWVEYRQWSQWKAVYGVLKQRGLDSFVISWRAMLVLSWYNVLRLFAGWIV